MDNVINIELVQDDQKYTVSYKPSSEGGGYLTVEAPGRLLTSDLTVPAALVLVDLVSAVMTYSVNQVVINSGTVRKLVS